MQNYSVLMSVYYREKPEFLYQAMNSLWKQTKVTNNFILVCDGPLNEGLDLVIDKMQVEHPEELVVVRLIKNSGLGNALNAGMKYCKNELVARMDSDDISRPDRCERQLIVFQEHPEVSICSGTIEEFAVSIDQIDTQRVLPEKHEDILMFARNRNPFNHPCVMYKKTEVEGAGGYRDFYLLEDYYLWIRMLLKGSIGYNIQQPLLWMRAGSEMYKRRAGLKYARSQIALFKYMRDVGFVSSFQYMKSSLIRSISSLSPNWIREAAFKARLRES